MFNFRQKTLEIYRQRLILLTVLVIYRQLILQTTFYFKHNTNTLQTHCPAM